MVLSEDLRIKKATDYSRAIPRPARESTDALPLQDGIHLLSEQFEGGENAVTP